MTFLNAEHHHSFRDKRLPVCYQRRLKIFLTELSFERMYEFFQICESSVYKFKKISILRMKMKIDTIKDKISIYFENLKIHKVEFFLILIIIIIKKSYVFKLFATKLSLTKR